MKKKKTILLVVLLMTVGFAAVSTTLYINGSTKINANQDDFNVYYSDALVNGTQDLSVIADDTHIIFTTTLETLGEKYELDYDVTNGSKNYDAEVTMECTQGNDYLSVTNEFDTTENLAALATRSGKLTLELIKSYAGEEDMDVTITCTIDANAIERDSLGEGTAAAPVKPLAKWIYTDSDNDGVISVGDIYTVKNESFNVISQTEDTVTMLAQYNLGTDYKQSTTVNNVQFSDTNGWEYQPGPKEIDVQTWSTNPKTYVNEYVSYLKSETGDTSINGNLITLNELKDLGCTINDDYSYTYELTCANSNYASWLISENKWWTRSAASSDETSVWMVSDTSLLLSKYIAGQIKCNCRSFVKSDGSTETVCDTCPINKQYTGGIRPVITISKSALK